MSKQRVVIFDWDGTLADSEAAIVRAMRDAYHALQYRAPSAAEIRDIIGLNMEDAVARLSPQLARSNRDEVIANYRINYRTQVERPKLFPDVELVLRELYLDGYALAVATGKSQRGLKRSLDDSNLSEIFTATRAGDQCESKPSPSMLFEIMLELGVPPDSALMIGDTEFDLAMAQAAGIPCAAVSYGAHDVQRLNSFDPVFVLDNFADLPDELDRHFT